MDTDELMDDTGEEQAWYPPVEELLSWFIPLYMSALLVFNDYNPLETEQLIDDMGDEQSWYPPIDTDSAVLQFVIVTELFVENDYAPLELEQLIEDSEGDFYPDFSIDLTWYFVQVFALTANLYFNEYVL